MSFIQTISESQTFREISHFLSTSELNAASNIFSEGVKLFKNDFYIKKFSDTHTLDLKEINKKKLPKCCKCLINEINKPHFNRNSIMLNFKDIILEDSNINIKEHLSELVDILNKRGINHDVSANWFEKNYDDHKYPKLHAFQAVRYRQSI